MRSKLNTALAAALSALALTGVSLVLGLAASPANAQPTAGGVAAEYRLGSGDVVRITVYQNPDLTLETRVTEAGVVSYPLLGNIRLGGLSVTASEKLIAEGLRNGNFVKQPQVNVVVVQVRGNQANVLGQVNKPGRYPIEAADTRLTDLLAAAGGTAIGSSDLVVVTGARNGERFRVEIDLPSLFSADAKNTDLLVQNGDIVWVERQPLVYIYGEAQRPGQMRLERGLTLMQTLSTGGGLTPRGTEKGIRVHRKTADGRVIVITPTMDERMQDGDVVYVRESLF
jgi:polysaccharide export outer membrane protein